MKKNAFTLIELLSVIVLLGLIMGLAVPGISKISTRMGAKSYNTKKQLIESAAVLWGQDNKSLLKESSNCNVEGTQYNCKVISINELIESNYLDSDNNSGEIIDPLTSKSMNDNCVFVYKKNNRVYAYYTNKAIPKFKIESQAIQYNNNSININLDNSSSASYKYYFDSDQTKNDVTLNGEKFELTTIPENASTVYIIKCDESICSNRVEIQIPIIITSKTIEYTDAGVILNAKFNEEVQYYIDETKDVVDTRFVGNKVVNVSNTINELKNTTYYLHLKDNNNFIRTISYDVSNASSSSSPIVINSSQLVYDTDNSFPKFSYKISGENIKYYFDKNANSSDNYSDYIEKFSSVNGNTYIIDNRLINNAENTTYYFHFMDLNGNKKTSAVVVSNCVPERIPINTHCDRSASNTPTGIVYHYNSVQIVDLQLADYNNNYTFSIESPFWNVSRISLKNNINITIHKTGNACINSSTNIQIYTNNVLCFERRYN